MLCLWSRRSPPSPRCAPIRRRCCAGSAKPIGARWGSTLNPARTAQKIGSVSTPNISRSTRANWNAISQPGATDEGLSHSPGDHVAGVVARQQDRPGPRVRRGGALGSCRAAAGAGERHRAPDPLYSHAADHSAHARVIHLHSQRHLARPCRMAAAWGDGERARVRHSGSLGSRDHQLVRQRIHRRLGPDRTAPPHRSQRAANRLMDRGFALLGSVSAFLAVAAGAFGAHALRNRLPSDLLAAFETGARYQMYHALALLFVAWAASRWPAPPVRVAGWMFVGGTVCFSGSLYLLSLTGTRWLGAVTPLGGVLFLGGWLALAVGIWRG